MIGHAWGDRPGLVPENLPEKCLISGRGPGTWNNKIKNQFINSIRYLYCNLYIHVGRWSTNSVSLNNYQGVQGITYWGFHEKGSLNYLCALGIDR